MKQEILTQFPSTWMTLFALFIFMILFFAFAVYIYFVEKKANLEYQENIPFQIKEYGDE